MLCVSGRFPFCIIPVGKARKPSVRGFLAAPLGLLPYSELQLYVPCRLLRWGGLARCRCLQPWGLSRRTAVVLFSSSCWLLVAGVGLWLLVACWSLVLGCLLAVGCRWLFVGCSLWVVACRSLRCCLLFRVCSTLGRLSQVSLLSALEPHTSD